MVRIFIALSRRMIPYVLLTLTAALGLLQFVQHLILMKIRQDTFHGGDVSFDPDVFPDGVFYATFHSGVGVTFAIVVLGTQMSGYRRRFVLPISTRLLVAWQLVSGMVTVAVCGLMSLVALRWQYQVDWPLVGIVPMAATFPLMVWSVWHFTPLTTIVDAPETLAGTSFSREARFIARQFLAILPGWILVGGWLVWRLRDATTGDWSRWDVLTSVDALAIAGLTLLFGWLTVRIVDRERHGDATVIRQPMAEQPSRCHEAVDGSIRQFADGVSACAWLLRQSARRLVMVAAMLLVPILVFILLVATGSSRSNLEGAVALLSAATTAGGLIVGVALGFDFHHPQRKAMRTSLAALPLSDAQLASVSMATLTRTVVSFWLLILLVAGVVLVGAVTEHGWEPLLTFATRNPLVAVLRLWTIPLVPGAALVMLWTMAGLVSSLAWTGRETLLAWIVPAPIVVFCVGAIGLPLVVPPHIVAMVMQTVLLLMGLAAAAGTVMAMTAAYRRGLISARVPQLAAAFWIAVVGGTLLLPLPPVVAAAICGLLSLTVLPVAAGPLALSWNRHR